jgi:hypothetical protein
MQNVQDEMIEQVARKSVNLLESNYFDSKLDVTA